MPRSGRIAHTPAPRHPLDLTYRATLERNRTA